LRHLRCWQKFLNLYDFTRNPGQEKLNIPTPLIRQTPHKYFYLQGAYIHYFFTFAHQLPLAGLFDATPASPSFSATTEMLPRPKSTF